MSDPIDDVSEREATDRACPPAALSASCSLTSSTIKTRALELRVDELTEALAVLRGRIAEQDAEIAKHQGAELKLVGTLVGSHWRDGLDPQTVVALDQFFHTVVPEEHHADVD